MKQLVSCSVLIVLMIFLFRAKPTLGEKNVNFWEFQSIDTMKYSRDLAREKLRDYSFDSTIAFQTQSIARMGATHIAIATPFDEEFVPFLKRWIKEARKNNLKIWFRGNWSGWERWFEYPAISRKEHIEKTHQFILDHHDLFEDGDVFSPCPECENGGPGDPRMNGDTAGHRQFLIEEYQKTTEAFRKINKKVASNYASMNGDVAKLVMDQPTTKALGGLVVIDHYVKEPQRLVRDIKELAAISGGKIVLGEFGAPILDIHGDMSQEQQAAWIDEALLNLIEEPSLVGLSYWVSTGGSTEIFPQNGNARLAAGVLSKYYLPKIAKGRIVNEIHEPAGNILIQTPYRLIQTSKNGEFRIPFMKSDEIATISGTGFVTKEVTLEELQEQSMTLSYVQETFFFRLKKKIFTVFSSFSLR